MNYNLYKLEIFIPESHLQSLSQALNEVDAGHIGNYDSCLSYSRVTSTWRPLEGTNPFIGNIGQLSIEEELKVEVTCKAESLDETIWKIRNIHPYEEPVINIIPMVQWTAPAPTVTDSSYRQYRFDDHLNIVCESSCREMTDEERKEYDSLVKDSTQLNLFDFI